MGTALTQCSERLRLGTAERSGQQRRAVRVKVYLLDRSFLARLVNTAIPTYATAEDQHISRRAATNVEQFGYRSSGRLARARPMIGRSKAESGTRSRSCD